jgi:HSP20 family protein
MSERYIYSNEYYTMLGINMLPDIWRRPWSGSSSLFEEMNREFVSDIASSTGTLTGFPYYYGYQITVGSDGKPRIKEFGNVKPAAKGLVEQRGARQPLVDSVLDEKENTLRITAEMPGINKEDIKLNVTDHYVTIHAERGDKKYHADIPVSVDLDESSAKASYTNGILELKIKPKEASKAKGKAIKIE